MTTIDRISELMHRCGFPRLPDIYWGIITGGEGRPTFPEQLRPNLHEILNAVDSAVGADTEWLSSLECGCLWHIGKACNNRRAVGARVRMLEEVVALNDLKKKLAA